MVRNPARAIAGAIGSAGARWSNRAFAPRVRAREAVCARTGYSSAAVEYAFDALFGTLRPGAIEAVIADELGSIDVLDGFCQRAGRPRARALPAGRVGVVSSRTTIGVAIVPAVFALCAKCDVLVKDREDRLVASFFETLAEELPDLRDRAIARPWSGAGESPELFACNVVVAFGSDVTLTSVAERLRFPARLIAYGSKASAGYVTRESLASEGSARALARGAARDLVLYDTEGCLSLHALFVERGASVSPERFVDLLAAEIRDALAAFPASAFDGESAVRRAAVRDLETFRGRALVYSDRRAGYLAVLDPPTANPPAFLPLTLGVHSVDGPSQAADYLERHDIGIEALAVGQMRPDVRSLAERLGAARIASFGTLQAPPLGAFHGGRPRISDFVRWIVDET
jgi:hypothetical protein